MDKRMRFRAFVGILVAVIIVGVLFVEGSAFAADTENWAVVASAVILVAIALAAALVARKRLKETKSGIPSEDERSTALKMRAGYLSFFVSMYLCMALGWIFLVLLEDTTTDFPPVGELMFILVAAMGTTYLVIWTAVSRGKGMS
ncbi:MAG: DUF2178 domain-containing protein [Thermoplasmata archaeon]